MEHVTNYGKSLIKKQVVNVVKSKKYIQKCHEIVEYEEKTLNEVQNRIEKSELNLKPLGLEITVALEWNIFGEEKFYRNRIPFKEGYCGLISVTISKKGQNPFDESIINFNRVLLISDIRKNFLSITLFEKFPVEDAFYDGIMKCYNAILEIGYDKFMEEEIKNGNY